MLNHVDIEYQDMFGDTGAQGHVCLPKNVMKDKGDSYVRIVNNVRAKIYQRDNVFVEYDVVNKLQLNNIRSVEGGNMHIISSPQLLPKG